MDFLRDYFGEEALTFDEFVAKLTEADVQLKEDTGEIMIPKSRFDQVNDEKKEALTKLKELEETNMSEEEKREQAIKDAVAKQQELTTELAKVKAREVFVKANMTEEDYNDMLELVDTSSVESAVERATKMVSIIETQKSKHEKNVLKQKLEDIHSPNGGKGNDGDGIMTVEEFKNLDVQGRATLLKEQPEVYRTLVEAVSNGGGTSKEK